MNKYRPDRESAHRSEFEKNKRKIFMTQEICGICGKPVDKSLKYPNVMCATVDHIIPIAKGGHPSDINNLQLAHFYCNRQKSDKIIATNKADNGDNSFARNRQLPQSINWAEYRG